MISSEENVVKQDVEAQSLNVKQSSGSTVGSDYVMKDGKVTTTIKNFDPAIGMLPDKHYEIVVNVDFSNDAEADGRYVNIVLGEGMTYRNYQVINPDPTDSNEQEIGFINKGVISETIKPKKASYSLLNFRVKNGLLGYKLNSNRTTGFQISFDATVDPFIVHKPYNVPDAISVTAGVKETSIGNTKTDMLSQPTSPYSSYLYVGSQSKDVLLGTEKVEMPKYYHVFNNGTNRPGYFKSSKTTFTLAPGLTENIFIDYPSNCSIDENKLVCTNENYINTGEYPPLNISIDTKNLPAGGYVFPAPVIEITDIFGRKINESKPSGAFTLRVIDPTSVDNKLNVYGISRAGYQDYIGNTSKKYSQPDFLVSFTAGVVGAKDQVVEMEWTSYETNFVSIPNNLNKVTEIQYKTNKNQELRTASGSQLNITTLFTTMSSESVGLTEGEYFTFVKAHMGDFEPGYSASYRSDSIGYFEGRYLDSRGKPVVGANQISQVLKLYSEKDGVIDPKSVATRTLIANKYSAKSVVSVDQANAAATVVAGEKVKTSYKITPSPHFYNNETQFGLSNPVVYFKNVNGVSYSDFSISKSTPGFMINSVSLIKGADGNDYTRVEISGDVGQYYDSKKFPLTIDYTINTQKFSKGVLRFNDLVLVEMDGNAEARTGVQFTKNDVKEGKNYLRGNNIYSLNITPSAELYVNSFIRRDDGNIQPPYNEEDSTTAVGLVPNSQVKYTVEIMNSMTSPVNSVETFIPVPKEGKDFGKKIQNKPFSWNMKLLGAPVIQVEDKDGNIITDQRKNAYIIEYATDGNESNFEQATYSNVFTQNTEMIRVKATNIQAGEKATLVFDYAINETPDSVSGEGANKLGKINDFRPFFNFDAGTKTSGYGTRVGAYLQIAKVSGQIFIDNNYN